MPIAAICDADDSRRIRASIDSAPAMPYAYTLPRADAAMIVLRFLAHDMR